MVHPRDIAGNAEEEEEGEENQTTKKHTYKQSQKFTVLH